MQLARPSPVAKSSSQLHLHFIEQLKCMLHGMLFIQCYSNMEEQSKHQNCWAGHGRLTREVVRRPPEILIRRTPLPVAARRHRRRVRVWGEGGGAATGEVAGGRGGGWRRRSLGSGLPGSGAAPWPPAIEEERAGGAAEDGQR